MLMTPDSIRYALAKQLPNAQEIVTNYGILELDDELRIALAAAFTAILKARLESSLHD